MESVSGADVRELKLQAYDPFDERKTGNWTRALTDIERKSLAGEEPRRPARGYAGHEHLERTGLIHMNGRVYDPVIGRFLSPNPVVAGRLNWGLLLQQKWGVLLRQRQSRAATTRMPFSMAPPPCP